MQIPYEALSEAALHGVIEEFITREGTHYGAEAELDLAAKREQVIAQLRRGDLVMTFDPESETCSLVHRDQMRPGSE